MALGLCQFACLAYSQNVPQRHIETSFQDYDAYGNPQTVTWRTLDGYSSVTTAQYDNYPDSWLIGLPKVVAETQTSANGESVTRTMAYQHDSNTGFLASITIEPGGDPSVYLVRTLTPDKTGLPITVQDASTDRQRVTQILYDTLENTSPAAIINPLSQSRLFAYHPSFGTVVEFQDENNNSSRWQVDGFGRVRSVLPPDGSNVSISYMALPGTSPTGFTVAASKAGGQELFTVIDSLGRASRQSHRGFDGRRIFVDKFYDSTGRLSRVTNPYFENEQPAASTSMTFDPIGRLAAVTYPDGSMIQKAYSGLDTVVVDEEQNLTVVTEDQLRRPTVVNQQGRTLFTYGPFDVVEAVRDPLENVTRATFDVRGRRQTLLDPDSGLHTSKWNAFDEKDSETDQLGNHSVYTRDQLGRPFKIDTNEGTSLIFWDLSLNGVGKISSATSASSDGVSTFPITTFFGYDGLSRLSTVSLSADGRLFDYFYGYDSVGRLSSVVYPAPAVFFDLFPFTVSFDYTPYGALEAVKDSTLLGSGATFWKNTDRNEFDQVTGETYGNGVVTTREIDSRGRLRLLTTTSNGVPVQDLTYQYYPRGNLQSRTDGIEHVVEAYQYDPLNRLVEWDVNKNDSADLKQQFGYDAIGNLRSRTTIFGTGDNLTYGYSGVNAGPHAVTSVNSDSYSYDQVGREISGPGRNTEYWSWGLPKRVVGSALTSDLKYDFQNQRILKIRSDGIHFVTVGGLFERISPGSALGMNTYYVRAGGHTVAAVTRDEASQSNSVEYLHDDRLGSVAAITDENGRLLDSRAYDPFGTTRTPADPAVLYTPSSGPPLGFAGNETDPEVGLLNMVGRLYDPRIGRFTTPDPYVNDLFSSQSYNRYSYALNNPLRWSDPTGLASEPVDLVPYYDDACQCMGLQVVYQNVPSSVGSPAAGIADDAAGALWQQTNSPVTGPTAQPPSGGGPSGPSSPAQFQDYWPKPGNGVETITEAGAEGALARALAMRGLATLAGRLTIVAALVLSSPISTCQSGGCEKSYLPGVGGPAVGEPESGQVPRVDPLGPGSGPDPQQYPGVSGNAVADPHPTLGPMWAGPVADRPLFEIPDYTGGPTRGVLDTGKAQFDLESGLGTPLALPFPGRNNLDFDHVEAYAAQIMRIEGISEAWLYLNQEPCAVGPGCANNLPRMLPEGATLHVFGPNGYNETFTGLPDSSKYPR